MGILAVLKLPPTPAMRAAAAAPAKKAARKAESRPAAKAAPHAAAAPETVQKRAATPVGATAEPPAAAATAAAQAPAGAQPPSTKTATESSLPPIGVEGGFGDFGGGVKKVPGGWEVAVKYEPKLNLIQKNFKVWVVPCFLRVQLKATLEGGGEFTDEKREGSVSAKGTGVAQIGPGGTSPEITVGFYGAAELSAEMKVVLNRKGLQDFVIDPFAVKVYGTGKLGMTFEIEDSWSATSECELVRWHLATVHFGAYKNGTWGPVSVTQGDDIDRIAKQLQQIGPTVANAVEKYAPEAVKKAAEDGARWVAESDTADRIAKGTGTVLDTVKDATGVDGGAGAEKVVQVLVDPDGETANEATDRVNRETAILNASSEDFHNVVVAAGLYTGGPLASRTPADVEDYNRIVAVKSAEDDLLRKGQPAPGAWRQMVVDLVAKRTKAKKEREAAAAAKKKAEADAASAAAAADLAKRVKQAEADLQAAWTQANYYGNPLNNSPKATPDSKARKAWTAGMMKYFNKGVQAKQAMASLQGEARIAKAGEAAAHFRNAATVFQEGMRMLG
jgi:hypothetical protein